jgi:hypothetical protein
MTTETFKELDSLLNLLLSRLTKNSTDTLEVKHTEHNGLSRIVVFQKNPYILKAEITFYGKS